MRGRKGDLIPTQSEETETTVLVASEATAFDYRHASAPRLPHWAVVLLARVEQGETVESARYRSGSKVSHDTIKRYGEANSAWYVALMDAEDGSRVGAPVTAREVARARETSIVNTLGDIADASEHPRDQISAGRVVLEASSAISRAPNVVVPIQINVTGGDHTAWVEERRRKRLPQE